MTKAELQDHADHLGRLFHAADRIACALYRETVQKTRKGSVSLLVADTDKPAGGYAMLNIRLPANGSPTVEYGTLDDLERVYYRAAVSGTKEQYILDAHALLSEATRKRNV